jgi:hypothetical protein
MKYRRIILKEIFLKNIVKYLHNGEAENHLE